MKSAGIDELTPLTAATERSVSLLCRLVAERAFIATSARASVAASAAAVEGPEFG